MSSDLKQRLRRRLLGLRFYYRLLDTVRTVAGFGNRHYLAGHPELAAAGFNPSINNYEFSNYSQNGEDGIILHLLSKAGVANHTIVEIGTEDARECNSANLIFNFGWNACLIEKDGVSARKAREYLASMNAGDRVQVLNEGVTPDNINALLAQARVPEEMDVLSIDIDSFDYWVWQAVSGYRPRIVVIEYNASFGPDLSVTVPAPQDTGGSLPDYTCYHGASITALQRLGVRKGYDLVGGDSNGVNAFFVRRDLVTAAGLQPVSPAQAYRPHRRRSRKKSQQEQYRSISHLPLVTIE
jgi:hypothetical protein